MSKHNDPPSDKRPFGRSIKAVELADIARRLAHNLRKSGRPYCLLTGIERGPAGIPEAYHRASVSGADDELVGSSFSFCVDGCTYTAFEDPEDGYRSAMGNIAVRPGNHCQIQFEPCACVPVLSDYSCDDDAPGDRVETAFSDIASAEAQAGACLLSLEHPLTGQTVLSVGTDYSEDYYPSFVGYHDPEALSSAQACGLALAGFLDETLASGTQPTREPRL
jgi:hypothetical protein